MQKFLVLALTLCLPTTFLLAADEETKANKRVESAATVLAINGGYRTVPTLVLPDGRVLIEPTRQTLLSEFGPAS